MDDLISRQAAIDALEGEIEVIGKANAEAVLKYTKMVCDRIKALPSAQSDVPERNVGKWIFGFDEETGERDLKAWTCSLCGEKYPWQPNFCPHCGARMNGKETEDAVH